MESEVTEETEVIVIDGPDRYDHKIDVNAIIPWKQPGGRRYCGHDSGHGKIPGQPRNAKCNCGSGKKAKHCCK